MNKGFTLIESILVLSLVSVFLLIIPPFFKVKGSVVFTCEKIKDILIHEKALAIRNKEERVAIIHTNYVQLKEKRVQWEKDVYCDTYEVIFNPRGNANHGGSTHCYNKHIKKTIVINLGSGNIYVK